MNVALTRKKQTQWLSHHISSIFLIVEANIQNINQYIITFWDFLVHKLIIETFHVQSCHWFVSNCLKMHKVWDTNHKLTSLCCFYLLQVLISYIITPRGTTSCQANKWWDSPLSAILFIWVRYELGSSEGYVQCRQRQISVGEADQLDGGHTLVVVLYLLGDDLQLWGSGLGRSPVTCNTHHKQSSSEVRELKWLLIESSMSNFASSSWLYDSDNWYLHVVCVQQREL